MQKLIFTILFIGSSMTGSAQIMFQKAFGGSAMDDARSVRQTFDNGYIIAGTTTSYGSGGRDILVIKTDASGDTLWSRTFGGATDNEYGFCVQQTTDSGYIVSGVASSFADVAGDMYLLKLNSSGDTIWTITYGSIGGEWGNYVQQTTDGGYILIGQTPSYGAGGFDAYLVKTDAAGNILWTRTYGGSGLEIGYAVQQTSDGGYILSGQIDSYGAGLGDFYLVKTDGNGNVLWSRVFGVNGVESGVSVRQTSDGGYVIGGSTESTGTLGLDMCLLKTSSNGTLEWAYTYGGSLIDECYEVIQTTDGGYILCGKSFSFSSSGDYDAYVVKTNPQGIVEWSRTYGTSGSGSKNEIAYSIQQTNDGGFVMAGESMFNFGVGFLNVYLIKTDFLGNSSCNQSFPATVTTLFNPQILSPPTLTSTGGVVSFPATLVGSGTVQTDLCQTTTELNEIQTNHSATLFPNPFDQHLSITLPDNYSSFTFEVFNLTGQKVYTTEGNIDASESSQVTINLKELKPGIYYCRITSGEFSETQKLIKK